MWPKRSAIVVCIGAFLLGLNTKKTGGEAVENGRVLFEIFCTLGIQSPNVRG